MELKKISTPRPFSDFFWIFQVSTNKIVRIFLTCFNVDPEFAASFRFQKAKGQGEFAVKHMLAAFNKEAGSGEFFIEFDEYVWEHKLIESFQAQGACQVSTITFAHNDGGESAANALVRILASQKKSGNAYTRGVCPPALYAKLHAKMEEAIRQEQLAAKEFDEKTKAAIMQSLQEMDGKVKAVNDNVQSYGVKLESIEGGVQSQAVNLVDIKQGVCNVIPDYQNEVKALKEALAHKTKLCDRIEGQKGRLTMEINKLKWELGERKEEVESLRGDKLALARRAQELEVQLDMCQSIALLKQMQEEAQRTAEILASTLEEERAAKRPRAC